MLLRKKCILLLSVGMSYEYQLSLSVLMCHLKLVFSYEFSVWMIPLTLCRWNDEVPHCSFLKKKKILCLLRGWMSLRKKSFSCLYFAHFSFVDCDLVLGISFESQPKTQKPMDSINLMIGPGSRWQEKPSAGWGCIWGLNTGI